MAAGQKQDALAIAQNGGMSGQEADDGDLDADADDGMDDDMMDKISSSPSIEDGGSICTLPPLSLRKVGSSCPSSTLCSLATSPTPSDARSFSPYLDHPKHLPLSMSDQKAEKATFELPSRHHHLQYGEFSTQDRPIPLDESTPSNHDRYRRNNWPAKSETTTSVLTEIMAEMERLEQEATAGDDVLDDDCWDDEMEDAVLHRAAEQKLEDVDEAIGDIEQDDLTVPYESSDKDDDGDFSDIQDTRFLDSGWGGDCLQDTEDIDFEFVYALHTFVATVEGQANATKGDTMVLLDDSNSYWWLVRVVKDSSIGYLPAEHIETPTERLARLNKHRNIDLSATMLCDQAEKPRNPIKTAIKRRKTKTVTFSSPTYVDYSDFDYSTDEEDIEAEYFDQQEQQAQQSATKQANAEPEVEDETAKVEPLKPRAQQSEAAKTEPRKQEANSDATASATAATRTSEEIFETKSGDGPKKASDGTVRDSFFKDDTVETKKITLTPNLLRDDNAPRASTESKEVKQRPSLDKLDKDSLLGKDDKKKKDKKEKEKKPSVIRNFFSRKGKKDADGADDDSLGKRSMDAGGGGGGGDDGQENEVAEEEEAQTSPEKSMAPQRHPSKLQKQQPRTEPSPTRRSNVPLQKESASMRIVDPDLQESPESSPRKTTSRDRSPKNEKSNVAKIIASRAQSGESRPQRVTNAKSRTGLDDFDSSDEEAIMESTRQAPTFEEGQKPQQRPTLPGTYPDSYDTKQSSSSDQTEKGTPATTIQPQRQQDRLSESPVQVSPVNSNNPPPLMVDTSSQEEDHSSSRSTPELIEREDGEMHGKQDSITTSTSTTTTSTWNDASLRAFFDSGSDIRDLLVVVYDKSDVAPAGPDHPVAGSLFREQNAKLAEITTQLDNMLGDWLARKQRLRGTI
ncbi:hypothetical protein QBC33DRAFT_532700 [Phialemonium atrogriseum]|uniref:SH3 domain-containing protein n=1 Tax=Phialemonium atrogriseum TaxID=1093897 RepID=A0AAJ0C492_9PEZI|nr:uncharacterized protein QBC33DRAFT_532700 [Phialemonium atrogriseum]KAK1769232.1 hypothetical protein QBC33DRAFT_532700 [Phialemonium atrogriseum]